jgi:hypothetical protein
LGVNKSWGPAYHATMFFWLAEKIEGAVIRDLSMDLVGSVWRKLSKLPPQESLPQIEKQTICTTKQMKQYSS